MKFKNKKRSLFFTLFSAAAIGGTAVSLALTLTSCNSEKTDTNLIIPTAGHSTFSNLNDSLTPVLASVLSTKEGRESVVDTAANKILSSWFQNIENPTLNADYTEWKNSAEKSYENKLKDYKDNKGSNWKKLFQIEVLDPVGGTKEAYIENQINQNLQSTFINNLFAKNYEGVAVKNTTSKQDDAQAADPMQGRTIYSINTDSGSIVNDPENINGLGGAGKKNAFVFSAETITDANRQSVDYGYADFMDFLMDSWVKNELPLPISMSLWKNAENPAKSGLFDTNYFTDIGDSGSYNFQYFTPSSPNNQVMTTTDKYKFLVKELQQGKFVDTKTGAINLPKDMTEDSSTTMTITADKLFDGSIATPFSAAAWYKFNNELFGVTDAAMGTANALDTNSIMGNFLVNNISPEVQNSRNFSTSKTGIFAFPYLQSNSKATTGTDSSFTPFKGEYADAKGVVDTVNITSASASGGAAAAKDASVENNFIITRDSFGVHLIGIDRLSQMKAAVTAASKNKQLDSSEQTMSKYNAVTTEIRNTFMWRAAQDIVKNESNYKLQDTLKTYLQDNFSKLIVEYASKAVSDTSNTSNNLFGQKVMTGAIKSYTDNGGHGSTGGTKEENSTNQKYNNFKDVLAILDKTNLMNFITSNNQLDIAERSLKFVNNVKQQIYANQSSYSNTTNYEEWKNYGIAGVPPYTRDSKTGNFDSLIKLVNDLVQNVKAPSTSGGKSSSSARNDVSTNNSQTVTVDDGALGQSSSQLSKIDNAYKFVLASKLSLMQNIAKLLNEGSTKSSTSEQVNPVKYNTNSSSYLAQPSYIFTNDDYVNNAIEAVSKAGKFDDIIQNLYTQNYLTNQTPIDNKKPLTRSSSRSASEEFYDFRNNKIDTGDTREVKDESETSTDSIKKNIQNAINSNYLINNFKNLPNLYSDGDWNELQATSQSTAANAEGGSSNGVINIAQQVWTKSWITSQYTYNVGGKLVVAYEDPSVSSSYQKFLVTLEYLFDYSPENGGTFTFGNLKNFLAKITENNNRAMVAWVANSTIKQPGDSTFGVMGKEESINDQSSLRTEVMKDYQFQGNPVYLDKLTPYSWYQAPNIFAESAAKEELRSSSSSPSGIIQNSINWTNSSNYWNTATMQKTEKTKSASGPSTGFLGFQVDNASSFGMSNSITSAAFQNSTYTTSASIYPLQTGSQQKDTNSGSFAYVGTLYQYGGPDKGKTNLVESVQKMSTINQLVDFYNNVLVDSNLPISNESKTEITNIINEPNSNQSEKIQKLSTAIIQVINTQIPEQAFQRLDALPLWNSNTFGTSTLFADGDGGALYNEYVVTMFNSEDVEKLTSSQAKDGSVTITDSKNGGFLGLTQDAFYSAVIMLAANNTQLQDDAMKAMLDKIGKISVYDQRLATSLDSSWIYNNSQWETLLDKISSNNSSSSN